MGLLKVARRRQLESSKRRLNTVAVAYKAKGESIVKEVPATLTTAVAKLNTDMAKPANKAVFSKAVTDTVAAIVSGTGLPTFGSTTLLATATQGGASPAQLDATSVVNATQGLDFSPTATAAKKTAGSTSSAAGAIVSGLTVLAAAFFTL